MGLYLKKKKDGTVAVAGDAAFTKPPPEHHHFPRDWVVDQAMAGIATLNKGQLILHAEDGDVAYDIARTPGAYCAGCGAKVGEGPATNASQVAERAAAYEDCCDADDGIEVINYFEGVRA